MSNLKQSEAWVFVRTVLASNFPGRRFTDREVRMYSKSAAAFTDFCKNPTEYAKDPARLTPDLVLCIAAQRATENSALLLEMMKIVGGE